MFRLKKKYTISLALLGAYFSTTMAAQEVVTDISRPIIVKSSEPMVTIRLPANPSTGYQWVLTEYDHELLEPQASRYFPPAKEAMGAAGYSQWQFKMKKNAFIVAQQTTIHLQYIRPWEMQSNHQQAIRILTQPVAEPE